MGGALPALRAGLAGICRGAAKTCPKAVEQWQALAAGKSPPAVQLAAINRC